MATATKSKKVVLLGIDYAMIPCPPHSPAAKRYHPMGKIPTLLVEEKVGWTSDDEKEIKEDTTRTTPTSPPPPPSHSPT